MNESELQIAKCLAEDVRKLIHSMSLMERNHAIVFTHPKQGRTDRSRKDQRTQQDANFSIDH
jgi:hypothetical protein